jgi:hypothetical protein
MAGVELKIIQAADAARQDRAASPAFRTVLEELERKAERVSELLDQDDESAPLHESLVELDEAGEIAKAAAEAEPAIDEDTRAAVRTAYQAIDELTQDASA